MDKILFVFSTLGFILWIADYTGLSTAATPAFTFFSQLVILYFFSLFGLLELASYFIYGLGFILLILVVVKNRLNIIMFIKKSATPGLILFLLLLTVLWFQLRLFRVANWDEFSHWGLIFKELVITNHLPTASSSIIFLYYPPGTAIFQYYIARLLGSQEGSAYFAQNLLLLSPIIALTSNLGWKKWFVTLGLFFSIYFSIFIMGFSPYSLLVDALLGITLGSTIVFFVTQQKKTKSKSIFIIPFLLAFPLIKVSGLFYSIIVILMVIGVTLTQHSLKEIKIWFLTVITNKTSQLLSTAAILLLIIGGPFFVRATWNMHVSDLEPTSGSQVTYSPSLSLNDLARPFSANASERDIKTRTAFIKGFNNQVYQSITLKNLLIGFFLIILLFGSITFNFKTKDQKVFFTVQMIMLFCFILYCIGLFFAYLYSFSEIEGTNIASFTRYIGSFTLGWLIIILGLLIQPLKFPETFSTRGQNSSILFLSLMFLSFFKIIPIKNYINVSQPLTDSRIYISGIVKDNLPKIKPNARIYDIWQNTNGFEHYVMRYELAPHQTQPWGWSLGIPYSNEDIWTLNIEPATWLNQLQGNYDYVLVSKADNIFWRKFGVIFTGYSQDQNNAQLFCVTPTKLVNISDCP